MDKSQRIKGGVIVSSNIYYLVERCQNFALKFSKVTPPFSFRQFLMQQKGDLFSTKKGTHQITLLRIKLLHLPSLTLFKFITFSLYKDLSEVFLLKKEE